MAVLNEEQSMLRDAAKSWVQEKSPVTAFRKMRDSGVELGYDADAWNEQAEMGWAGVIIPEEYGGSNFGYLSMGLILEEMGRTLTASPLLASGLAAASALILGGNEAQKGEYLPKIADGSLVATLAVDEGAHHAPDKVALAAAKSGAGYTLNGKKTFVLEGPAAGLLVVSARTSGKPGDKDGISLFLRGGVFRCGNIGDLHCWRRGFFLRGLAHILRCNIRGGSGRVRSGWLIAFAEHRHRNADHDQQHRRHTDDGKQLFIFCVHLEPSF